jgi:hypothetical protein
MKDLLIFHEKFFNLGLLLLQLLLLLLLLLRQHAGPSHFRRSPDLVLNNKGQDWSISFGKAFGDKAGNSVVR